MICMLAATASADLVAARDALAREEWYEALSQAQREVQSNPTEAYQVRAEAYLGLKDRLQAVGQLQRALSHSPKNHGIQVLIAQVMVDLGRLDQAVLYYEAAWRAEPANAAVARNLLETLARRGDATRESTLGEEALEYLEDGATRQWIVSRLGILLTELGEHEKAFQYLEESSTYDDATTTTLYLFARNASRRKDPQTAITAIDRAALLAPENDDIIQHRGEVLLKLERSDEAYREFWKLQKMQSPHWAKLPQTLRIATAQNQGQLPQVVAQQYGILTPLLLVGAGLAVLLLGALLFLLSTRSK